MCRNTALVLLLKLDTAFSDAKTGYTLLLLLKLLIRRSRTLDRINSSALAEALGVARNQPRALTSLRRRTPVVVELFRQEEYAS